MKKPGRIEGARGKSARREGAAAEVMLGALPALPGGSAVLVAEDRDGEVERGLAARGLRPTRWCRWSVGDRPGSEWPPDGPYAGAALRLPTSKEALEMATHAAAARLAPGAPLWLYGANDEGVRSAPAVLERLFGRVETLDARRHCRVLEARDLLPGAVRGQIDDWARWGEAPVGPARSWVSYPGLFARGALDGATAALLAALPPAGGRVLDFGCGAGVICAELAGRGLPLELHALDADALAVRATRANAPGVTVWLSDGWRSAPPGPFDAVVSNPPIHRGKAEDFGALEDLARGAAERLAPGGALWLVTQRQVPCGPLLAELLGEPQIAWEDNRFRVWRAGRAR